MPVPARGLILVAELILVAGVVGARNLTQPAGARRPAVPRLPLRCPHLSPPPLTIPPAGPAGLAATIQAVA
jgi:hypothetical protein